MESQELIMTAARAAAVAAMGTLVVVHLSMSTGLFGSATREWRRAAVRGGR